MLGTIEKVLLLQEVDILQPISTEYLRQIASITKEIEYTRGESIYFEGDQADAMYVVIDGQVQIHREGRTLLTAKLNDSFGVWALFDEEERVVTATTLEDTRLLSLEKDDFLELLANHSEITESVLSSMAKRLRTLLGRVSMKAGK